MVPDVGRFLRGLDRARPVPLTSTGGTYLRSDLLVDPRPVAVAAGVSLPDSTTATPVAQWALLVEPTWEVRLWFDRDEVPADRPYALVEAVGDGPTTGPAR